MNTSAFETTVYFTVTEDGSHLATAVSGPCFAVSGDTFEEVKARVTEILHFHAERLGRKQSTAIPAELSAKLNRTVRPFAPSYIEKFPTGDCVAA